MADVNIKNSLTNTIAAKRTRYEKMETAYGKIPAAAWAEGDTLIFDQIPMLSLVHAKFVSNGEILELFHGTDLTSDIDWDILNDGDSADVSYVVSYIRGTGKVANGTDQGKVIQLTVASSAP